MNTKIEASSSPSRAAITIRTKHGLRHFRRMWGGIAWPLIPAPSAVCIVGEEPPKDKNAEYGQLILLDQETAQTIGELLSKTIDLKDLYCVTHFHADSRNQMLFEKFQKANGLTRYESDINERIRWETIFPYFKETWMTAGIQEAPQADNPEYGLQLIHDWLYGEGMLKIERAVKTEFDEQKILPITKDMIKTGLPPVIEALRHVLAAYSRKPFYPKPRQGVNYTQAAEWSPFDML